jgi:hypothetical protein
MPCDIEGEYVGDIECKGRSPERRSLYVACLGKDELNLGIDAMIAGNEMRFINAFLGIGERANVEMKVR